MDQSGTCFLGSLKRLMGYLWSGSLLSKCLLGWPQLGSQGYTHKKNKVSKRTSILK
jgi:hypothetical protein